MGVWIDWRPSWLGRCGRGFVGWCGVIAVECATRLGVSQARVTQILNLTYLVRDIPRELFELEAIDRIEPMSERPLRRVLAEEDWGRQKRDSRTRAEQHEFKLKSSRCRVIGDVCVQA